MEQIKKINFRNIDKIDAETLSVAKLIVEKKLIDINYKNEKIIARFPFKICNKGEKGSEYFSENLLKWEINKTQGFGKIVVEDLTRKCKNPNCSLEHCPLLVAAYFQNLCDTNPKFLDNIENISSIKSDEEIEKMISNLLGVDEVKIELRKLLKFNNKKNHITDSYKDSSQFYNNFVLVGNEGLQQTEIANIIKTIFINNAMINEKDYKEIYALDLDYDKCPSHPNLSDYENLIIKELTDSKLIYLKEFDKILSLKTRKEDFYYKLINTLKRIILENNKEKIFIVSGEKEKIKLIFDENSEFSSLFGYYWTLKDFDNEILSNTIIKKLEQTKIPIKISNEEMTNMISQLSKESNYKNLLFIEETYQKTLKNYFESDQEIIIDDLIPTTKYNVSIDDTMKEIDELIGMKNIKTELRNLSKFLRYNKRLEKISGVTKTLNLHMIFSGNAGTGKTTVARLLADILYNMGYIENNKITEITPKDLVGEFTGQTAPKARKTIENALGGVLFIDEAYSLANAKNGFGADAIVELLKCMEDYQDRLVIVFAGYHDEMNDFVNLNPGLKSRVRYHFEFEDYNEDELIEILKLKLNKLNMKIDEEAVKTLKRTISYNIKSTNFGNGRYVDNLVNNLLIKHSLNIPDDDDSNLLNITLDDVNMLSETNEINLEDIFKDLNTLIGLKNVKEELYKLVDYLQYNKKLEKFNIYPKDINLHMVFSGNAGTGKTTVARMLSNIFYSLGYIPENRVTEVTAKDLTGEYLGQTAPKVRRQVENALGGVLFIDEAYSLVQNYSNGNGYSGEAIAELLVCMEKYYDRLIIVFSGYEKEMKDFINANPGLKSRIGKSFIFEDYSNDELTEILLKLVEDNHLKISESAITKFKELIEQSMKIKNFGNARFVRNTFDNILITHSTNTKNSDNKEELITITENDINIKKIEKNTNSSKNSFGFNINVKEKDNKETNKNIIETIEESDLL